VYGEKQRGKKTHYTNKNANIRPRNNKQQKGKYQKKNSQHENTAKPKTQSCLAMGFRVRDEGRKVGTGRKEKKIEK